MPRAKTRTRLFTTTEVAHLTLQDTHSLSEKGSGSIQLPLTHHDPGQSRQRFGIVAVLRRHLLPDRQRLTIVFFRFSQLPAILRYASKSSQVFGNMLPARSQFFLDGQGSAEVLFRLNPIPTISGYYAHR